MTTSTATPKKRSFLFSALPFFIIAHAAHHFIMALEQPLLPTIRDYFKISSYSETSYVPMSFALAGATGQLIGGWLADRIKPTILVMIDILGVAVAGILVGISSTYVMLIVFLMFMGILSGGYHPAATPLISASVPTQQRGRALGFHLVGGNAAFFVAPIIASGIIGVFGDEKGWRYSFLFLAIPTVLFALIFLFYLLKRGGQAHADHIKRTISESKPPQPGYKRRLIAFLTMMVIGGGIGMSVLPFLTVYMTDELGASKATAAGLMSIVFSSGLWAGPVGGYLGEKFGSVKIIIATGLISGLMLFAFKQVALGWTLYMVLFFHGMNMAMRMPVTEMFIISQAPAKHRSKIYGVYYSTMQYTGAIFVLPGGYLLDKFGFDTMFTVAAIGVTVVAVITGFLIYDAKDHYEPPELDGATVG